MNINKVSQSIKSQTPDFVESEYSLFNKFLEYYYKSQEKTGLGQNILNNFLGYLDIDKLDIQILDGKTKLVEDISLTSDTIVVETIDSFLEQNGSILIGDEVIFYEKTVSSPNIALSPGVSYDQVKLKWVDLESILNLFDGSNTVFPLTSLGTPVAPISSKHLIVKLYNEILIPEIDFQISGTNITFTTAPRTKLPSDAAEQTSVTYLKGFSENSIIGIDNLSNAFGEDKTEFVMTVSGSRYEPITDEYIIAIYDNRLLIPRVDFFIDGDTFIFNTAPLNGRFLGLFSIEAPIPSFGSGAVGYSRVNNSGQITSVSTSETGANYRYEYPPKVTVSSAQGSGSSVSALVNGVKSVSLLEGGRGFSSTNPPIVTLEQPTKDGAVIPKLSAVVDTNGSVSEVTIDESGSGYTFTPRLSFKQPGGAKIGPVTIVSGQVSGTIPVTNGGLGYSTVPEIYVDEPTGINGIKASLQAVLTDGVVTSITVLNAGQGYETTPRVAVIDPVGAQILDVAVDGDGRVIRVDLLDGGSGYEDVPSVYIVDHRTSNRGTGATATAAIFNGRITDININNFGSGYSQTEPPEIIIQQPPTAKASVGVGQNELTGFSVKKSGSGYSKAKFEGCARAASAITAYTEDGNAVFSQNTTSSAATAGAEIKCLDALFVKRLLDKYTEQFLPDVPELDYSKIDVRTAIKTIKDFYTSKGTSFSIAYLFKLLYGEIVTVSYPKDQIIKPSAATWSVDTILRATVVSGDPTNIKDGLLTQDADIADTSVRAASALIENFLSIQTSDSVIYELILSEETINGNFIVPYKTRLGEPLNTTDSIITVDSTIGWPERNGEFIIGGTEIVRYKEKSLNQFIECTRSINNVVEDWDSATEVTSNFKVYVNKGTTQEVVMNIVGIVDAQQTTLTDTGSYYLPGDKLTISKLGGTSEDPELRTWLYNVKKLVEVTSITFGGINNQSATVTCNNPHGLLVGDQVTVYGANPIIYNGTFLVTSRDSETVFQYQLPQPAGVIPQGNILVSVDLNKGKSDDTGVLSAIGPYTTNIQNSFFNTQYVYVASTGIPNYKIGPFPGSALLPGNQRKLNRFPLTPSTISTKNLITPGPIGTWINGVSIWSYKSTTKKTFGAVTAINITNSGQGYDAASPPALTISGGNGTGAQATVIVNGSVSEITVEGGGTGYTSSPLVSIVGGGGSGASATAIITKGSVSRILINDGGTGYTSQPSITIVGGEGTGATATASVRGPIKSVSIDNGGQSYTSKPEIILSSGSGAVAQAIVNDGRIISIAIISAGQGYTTAPEIVIQGDGFGAVARTSIDVDGENAGRVTGIEIINRGIGYTQGTTVIGLNSIGSDAVFDANVFEWTYNLQETSIFDSSKGSVFEGFNNQYGGEYAHLSNPQRLRYILGDNLFENEQGVVLEQEDQLDHSPIIGWAFDGNPIYGPYGYQDPTDQGSEIARLRTSYRLKTNLVFNEITNPYPVRTDGPLLTEEAAGRFVEDYEFTFSLGDLDQYNGRFCKTPDFPEGRYCYFVTIDATEQGDSLFPYVLGPSFNSVVDIWNLNSNAIQQNIPTGVVRYRDPYENVDIDVERAPNASTNSITAENGDILLFEVEDENRDGIISQDETDDPDEIFEESPLQLFDYFPTVKLDSRVDIEVETITKFEDASVTGFIVENPGVSYQVNDQLVFDNTDTDGSGVSARVSRIKGETPSSYSFENISGNNFGVLQTQNPHNLQVGDTIFVDYTPVMDNTNKTFSVRQFTGIEEIVVNQTGSGYNEDIPPQIIIDGNGKSGKLEATVTTVGSIDTVNIINAGFGYTSNPRVILSHPQVFKKADYYVSLVENNEYVKINDAFVNANKESFICGVTEDSTSNKVAFIAKLSATGVKEWEKTLELTTGQQYAEFQKVYVDGSDVWVVGINRPNSVILNNYNPDIILVKYTQSENGLDATLTFQKAYSGISGSSRSDNITSLQKMSDTRYVIGGFTNTNSSNPYDSFLATIDLSGNFALKRKVASASKSEKITDISVSGSNVFFTMETADDTTSDDVNVSFGKATVNVNSIDIEWIKEYSNSLYSFFDSSVTVDEFDEYYITSTLRLKSDDTTKDSVWIGKVDTDGDFIWNYRYVAPGGEVTAINKSHIDIFGDLNVGFSTTDSTTSLKTVDILKLNYKGELLNHTNNKFNLNRIEGITAHALNIDNSGDVYVFGQTSWNRNEFILEFATDATDKTGNYTPTLIGDDATDALVISGDGVAKLLAKDVGTPANWENSAIKFTAASLGTKLADNWTLEFMLYKDAANSQTHSQTEQTLFAIGDAADATGGLWMYYDIANGNLECVVTNNTTSVNSSGSSLQSTQTNMYADDSWQFIALTKSGNVFTGYVNGIQVFTGTVSNTSLGNKDLYFGNVPGRDGSTGTFRSNEQGQYYLDNLRLRNRILTPTVPSDVLSLPPTASYALAFDWTDDAWFTTNLNRYDYIDYVAWGLKADKNADAIRLGDKGLQTNTNVGFVRTAVTPVTGSALTMQSNGFALGTAGIQSLDFDDATTTMSENTETLTYNRDVWGSRTATVPSPGSQKLSVSAVVKPKYYFKVTPTVKIDNIQELTINQSFNFTIGSKVVLNNGGSFVNSGYLVKKDTENNKIYLAVNNNAWSNDLNVGELSTEQFSEQSSYGIVGPIPNDVNEIASFNFAQVVNTTPGTFDIDLNDYNLDATVSVGSGNLDSFAKFKPFTSADYSIRIDEVSGSSNFIVGSVIQPAGSDVSFNAAYSTIQITGLTGVLKITLIANLSKILRATAVANSDQVYVITSTSHYLSPGEMIHVDGNPSETVNTVVYDEYDGSFPVDTVVSPLEFTYKLPQAAITSPATSASSVSIFVRSPVLKMYYGHQYVFDLGHSSMVGGNLSFSKDNLYKLEYSFNSIERVGIPGVTGEGQPNPTVKLKVDRDIVTNISYYFDPSRPGLDSPIDPNSYLDVVGSPYQGTFEITSLAGATITRGADIVKFPLIDEPEGDAGISQTSYSTSSRRAVGSISDIRITNAGGFYTRLPIVTSITSTRQIERVQIVEPGTEYAVGTYNSVPISGDGEGGFVSISVADGSDDEGNNIPGQIQSVTVTSPGKGYTTATVDVESVQGILGPGLAGSGAELTVVIPPFGSGASIFTTGDSVGKIKKLKNNNFGYDYPHDYTLRPEITFPINAQLTSTSILDSITVTDPGSGYSQSPSVVITGGGGSGAIAESTIRNGRLDQIIVKDPGSGYSSTPIVSLRSSFNYVINLDLGLLQFAFPHGIPNGSQVSLIVTDTGDGADFPLSSGALGRLNSTTTYFAITGTANSLEPDQMKLAITAANAELGDAITFVNAGTGRQSVLTESFGGAATANVITSTFLEGELVYQGDALDTATATGYVSTNNGWQIGPRVLKIVDYTGEFIEGQQVTGVISKSSGTISDLNVAKGVLEIGSITNTTGQFIDDVGKPSEIIQRVQDSYYYQDFSYAVNSSVSINEWKELLLRNVHPASFKVFGELSLGEYGQIPNKQTFFELTKSVELAREATVPNIQSFALVEPIYSEFNNTEVLFRQKRLTSSENILTSVVQRLDDISTLFDGERIAFPITVGGNNVVASADQLMVILNGVVQTPNTSFELQGDSIVFSEPPSPPASVKYVNITIEQIDTITVTVSNNSGIFPTAGNVLVGTTSNTRLTVTKVAGQTISGFITQGAFVANELVTVGATGFAATYDSQVSVDNLGLFIFGEQITNFDNDTAIVEQINLERGQETPLGKLRYSIGAATTSVEIITVGSTTNAPAAVPADTFVAGQNYQFGSEIFLVNTVTTGTNSTILTITRGQSQTAIVPQQENTPLYGTQIQVTNTLTLSKTAGTYQSTPGLFDIQLDDVIIGAQSGVVARVNSTATYQDPVTEEFIGQVNISEGSTFFGLLFNRIASTTYPNVILDDISKSQVSIVDFDDNSLAYDAKFPSTEPISNLVLPYDNLTNGPLLEDEYIRNYQIEYGNNTAEFLSGEDITVRKLTFDQKQGTGFFAAGQVIKTRDTKAEVIGYNQARSTIYLGKIGRVKNSGQDYHTAVFNADAQLDTAQKKFSSSSLLLDGTGDHVSFAGSTEFGFGTNAFTLECWIRPTSVTGTQYIIDLRSNSSDTTPKIYLEGAELRYGSATSDHITGGTLVVDTWYHVAVAKSGTTTRLFLDGAQIGTDYTDTNNYGSSQPINIGANEADGDNFNGHIDEVRVSNTARYTAVFTPRNGIFQGDANTKLLLHFDGADAQTYTEDWSGAESLTNGEEFHNDAILATSRVSGAPVGFTGNSHRVYNAAESIRLNKDFIAKETVYLLLQQYPSLTIPGGNVNCEDDIRDILDSIIEDLHNGSNNHMWDSSALYVDRTVNPVTLNHVETEIAETIWAYNKVDEMLQYIITNVTWTIQGDHGLTQTLNTDPTNIYESGSASLSNCADVYTTINNLIDLLTDTLSEANSPSATVDGDHLGTVTKVEPVYEFIGGTVDAYVERSFASTYHDGSTDVLYSNRVDASSRDRFYDAANLIEANSAVIIDKTSYDLLQRYPDLYQDMPRNENGVSDDGIERCKTDLTLILAELIKDIRYGGNLNTVQTAKFYLGSNQELLHIRLQVWQSAYAHTRLANYMKQAINGDLTYDNTDNIIVGDWGITNDAGGCADVQTAIDNLIDTFNDIIAPTDNDYNIAADRLYFNRDAITSEVNGVTNEYLTYILQNVQYSAYTINASNYASYMEKFLIAAISDLQTGGTNSILTEIDAYLNSSLAILTIEDELLPFLFSVEKLKEFGELAIENNIYTQGTSVTGDQYALRFSANASYRDSETPSNIQNVVTRYNTLIDLILSTLSPGSTAARSATKNIAFNANYYREEIRGEINAQFGSNAWVYEPFLNELTDSVVHDIITTDTSTTQSAYNVSLRNITGTFTVGEVVTSSGTGTATVLEYNNVNSILYVGAFTGTAWDAGDTLTGANGGTATITGGGTGSVAFDGSGDYLRTGFSNTDFAFGSNAITVEAWVYWNGNNSSFQITGSTNDNFNWYFSSGNIGFWGGNGSSFMNFNTSISANRWYHVALVRTGTGTNQTKIYLDGVEQGTARWATYYSSMTLLVGRNNLSGTSYADGFISNLRIVKGTAVYTNNFVRPSIPFDANDVPNTVFLSCQGDNPITDNSNVGFAVTAFGNAAASATSAFISSGGVSSSFDWFTNPSNVQILTTARGITSNIQGQIAGTNLWTNPEALGVNWSTTRTSVLDNQAPAPDETVTAEKIVVDSSSGDHHIFRSYSLTAYETLDSGTVKFDSGSETFDTGAPTGSLQTYTISGFFKKDEITSIQLRATLDPGSNEGRVLFNLNLTDGTAGSIFTQGVAGTGITVDEYGSVPVGNEWFRAYITISFGYGFSTLRGSIFANNGSSFTGNGTDGYYAWGIKLNSGGLDPYSAVGGQVFYSDIEYNIKTFAVKRLRQFMVQALSNDLDSPSLTSSFYGYYDTAAASNYTANSYAALVRYGLNIIEQQLAVDSHYRTFTTTNGITLETKTYGTRDIPVGISSRVFNSDYIYGNFSDAYAEIESVSVNEGKIVKVYQRFTIDGDITDGPFTMNEVVTKQGAPSITGKVYGFYEDENAKYIDVEITAGPWVITDTLVGATNSTTAQISAIEDRIHIIDLQGEFEEDIPFIGYTSTASASPTSFIKTVASVTDNTGGKLTVDTESLQGSFESTSVVYPASSQQYLDVDKFAGFDASVGQRIASEGHVKYGITINPGDANVFTVGNKIYKIVGGTKLTSVYGYITDVDLDNNFIYVSEVEDTFSGGDIIGDFGLSDGLDIAGIATVTTKLEVAGAGSARIQDIKTVGLLQRLYLTEVVGNFTKQDSIKSVNNYRSIVVEIEELKARVKRSFRGFDGTQTNFKLSIENGTQYLPDPDGHLLIFVNGILQPPGATNAFTAFSNQIQFSEAPELGASFTGFYVGKLRQLDDISFEFDSLRQSFNLKRNEVFYSLTLTEGVQSSVIRPENNIIVSLNGVIQEPGIGFEIVGSRIIFSEIPRVGSTFVAFSYVGSEADVDAAEVVPPIEPGDFIDIQGETEDREVAVIESSNSLITFDYLGSVFGQNAIGQSNLVSGFIDRVSVTSGGSGYTSRPIVRVDSISGFDANIRALVGVAGVELNSAGSGYENPGIDVETSVPDDWTAPNLADYGEELIDPEILA
ncbi:structural protein [Synechococcus phage S-CAM8]|uniref:Structural protein n=1 Tax=Synechococcus phage S-CAM8 TaxID=754038 RepID=R9TM25_9CAUD|nr:virion structural protein [Synechococcus phage S-CAM8]AGN33923.1 structural protein [Synechococcus phage S-CAM8]